MNVVQVVSATASGATTVAATLTSTTTGNLIVVSSWWDTTGRTFTSVTDNKGNVYAAANNTAGSTTQVERIDYAKNSIGGITTVTLTTSGGANLGIVVYEIGGADKSAPLLATNVANSASATTLNATITTNEGAPLQTLIVSGFCNGDTSVDTNHSAGATVDIDINATAGGRFGAAHQIVAQREAAVDFGWTTAGAATVWAIVVAAFKGNELVRFETLDDTRHGWNGKRETPRVMLHEADVTDVMAPIVPEFVDEVWDVGEVYE